MSECVNHREEAAALLWEVLGCESRVDYERMIYIHVQRAH